MHDWNVIATVRGKGFVLACEFLGEYGTVDKTEYFNVLAMKVEETDRFIEELRTEFSNTSLPAEFLSRVIPVTTAFDFHSPEEFNEKAMEALSRYTDELAGKGFYIRMHRRGFKGKLSSMDEERLLGERLLDFLEKGSVPGRVTYEDPDTVIAVETLGQRAGLSLWSRDKLKLYPFLGLG